MITIFKEEFFSISNCSECRKNSLKVTIYVNYNSTSQKTLKSKVRTAYFWFGIQALCREWMKFWNTMESSKLSPQICYFKKLIGSLEFPQDLNHFSFICEMKSKTFLCDTALCFYYRRWFGILIQVLQKSSIFWYVTV